MNDEISILVIHRDIPGDHVIDDIHCWCEPTVIFDDGSKSTEEIIKESEVKWQ